MEALLKNKKPEPLNILLIGNNPIEMSSVLEKFKQLRNRKVITEIAFDLKTILERLSNFKPHYIFIDDNIGKSVLKETLNVLSSKKQTKHIPITVLKNSNYHEAGASGSVLDYLLKQNVSAEALYNTVKNTLKFKRTQKLLLQAYQYRQAYQYKKGFFNQLKSKSLDFIS